MNEEDDAAAWEGWDVETDSDASDSDSEPWHNVDSGGEDNLDISDSEDEDNKKKAKGKKKAGKDADEDAPMEEDAAEPSVPAVARISTLAQTKVRLILGSSRPA
jgi:protein SDA1